MSEKRSRNELNNLPDQLFRLSSIRLRQSVGSELKQFELFVLFIHLATELEDLGVVVPLHGKQLFRFAGQLRVVELLRFDLTSSGGTRNDACEEGRTEQSGITVALTACAFSPSSDCIDSFRWLISRSFCHT